VLVEINGDVYLGSRSRRCTLVVDRNGLRFGVHRSFACRWRQEAKDGSIRVHAIHSKVVDELWCVSQCNPANHIRDEPLESHKTIMIKLI
jgi:hypothetical protein